MRPKSQSLPLVLAALALLVSPLAALAQGADATDPRSLERLTGELPEPNPQRVTPRRAGLSVGPDVTIIDLSTVGNYTDGGADSPCPPGYGAGNCRGYSIGTRSCNIGTVPVDWCDSTTGCRTTTDPYHPLIATNTDFSVIGQSLYRLKDGRFEQLGLSFLKHGFLSTNSSDTACVWNDNGTPNTSCVGPPAGSDQLGVGCTDFYGSSLNGGRPLGRRSQTNGANGQHPNPEGGGETNDAYDQRIVVNAADLDPAQNTGALYFAQGQYIVRDDARSGNGLNNTSYRQITVGGLPDLDLTLTGPTVREVSVLYAWQAEDPDVEIVVADRNTFFAGEAADPPATGQTHPDHVVKERFVAARKLSVGAGPLPYHWEIVIQNLNSDTSAHELVVDLGGAATIGNAEWSGRPLHSGEPWATAPWDVAVDQGNGTITWSTDDYATDQNANALRFGQVFTFRFDTNVGPENATTTLGLFKIVDSLVVPFLQGPPWIFLDGFESGDTLGWSFSSP